MGWVAEAFRENTNLEHVESMRIFLFILKFISALIYIYVLGYLAAGGTFGTAVWVIVLVGAIIDLVPEALTVHSLDLLPDTARRAELMQLGLTAFAYGLLAFTLFSPSTTVFLGYVSFAILWISAFLIQHSVFFFLGETADL